MILAYVSTLLIGGDLDYPPDQEKLISPETIRPGEFRTNQAFVFPLVRGAHCKLPSESEHETIIFQPATSEIKRLDRPL